MEIIYYENIKQLCIYAKTEEENQIIAKWYKQILQHLDKLEIKDK